jgi:hypothetical protein
VSSWSAQRRQNRRSAPEADTLLLSREMRASRRSSVRRLEWTNSERDFLASAHYRKARKGAVSRITSRRLPRTRTGRPADLDHSAPLPRGQASRRRSVHWRTGRKRKLLGLQRGSSHRTFDVLHIGEILLGQLRSGRGSGRTPKWLTFVSAALLIRALAGGRDERRRNARNMARRAPASDAVAPARERAARHRVTGQAWRHFKMLLSCSRTRAACCT